MYVEYVTAEREIRALSYIVFSFNTPILLYKVNEYIVVNELDKRSTLIPVSEPIDKTNAAFIMPKTNVIFVMISLPK